MLLFWGCVCTVWVREWSVEGRGVWTWKVRGWAGRNGEGEGEADIEKTMSHICFFRGKGPCNLRCWASRKILKDRLR